MSQNPILVDLVPGATVPKKNEKQVSPYWHPLSPPSGIELTGPQRCLQIWSPLGLSKQDVPSLQEVPGAPQSAPTSRMVSVVGTALQTPVVVSATVGSAKSKASAAVHC